MARVLLNHGLGNIRPKTQWLYRTAVALRKLGHQVSYAQFPSPDAPVLEDWQNLLVAEQRLLLELGDAAGELIFVGHSLGALNFIQAASDRLLKPFDRTLLVAPADPALLRDLPVGALDLGSGDLRDAVLETAGDLTLVASDSDPWLPNGIEATFGVPLGITPVVIPGAKHFADRDGWGPWQGVVDWLLDPTADITIR